MKILATIDEITQALFYILTNLALYSHHIEIGRNIPCDHITFGIPNLFPQILSYQVRR